MKLSLTSVSICMAIVCYLMGCSNKPKKQTPEQTLLGKWQYERVERGVNTTEEEAVKMDKDNRGHTVRFDKDGKYLSMRTAIDTTETGNYWIIGNGEKVVTQKTGGTRSDTILIAELTQTVIRVKTPEGDVFILKRIE